jgi:hypothetical protein
MSSGCVYICVCLFLFQLLNQLTDFHKMWYERCAIKGPRTYVFYS